MKKNIIVINLLAGFVTVAICTFFLKSSTAGPVQGSVPVTQGKGSGEWRGRDLTVNFTYARGPSYIDLAGTVEFADYLKMGYSLLRDFQISAVFLGPNGRELGTKPITTDRGDFSPIKFRKRLVIPSTAESIAFKYQGSAIESGKDGGGVTQFWQ